MTLTKLVAWLGGTAFVASLASCAWLYFVELGRDVPPTGVRSFAVDAALLTIFAVHHSLFAREGIKRQLTMVPARMIRSLYVWVASLLLIAVCALWQPIGGEIYRATGARALAHAALQIGGLLLIARAVARLDPLEIAGIRQVIGRSDQPAALQLGGPYRFVRHPVYLGWMLVFFGAAHLTGDRLAFAGLTSLYLLLAVPWEERSLLNSFGHRYADYQRRVPWRIIPFVY